MPFRVLDALVRQRFITQLLQKSSMTRIPFRQATAGSLLAFLLLSLAGCSSDPRFDTRTTYFGGGGGGGGAQVDGEEGRPPYDDVS